VFVNVAEYNILCLIKCWNNFKQYNGTLQAHTQTENGFEDFYKPGEKNYLLGCNSEYVYTTLFLKKSHSLAIHLHNIGVLVAWKCKLLENLLYHTMSVQLSIVCH